MKTAGLVFIIAAIAAFSFQSPPEKPNAEEILKEFFGPNRSNDELIGILKKGAREPYKTELIKRVMAQSPDPDQASEVLAQKPVEPYAAQAWKIVEASGFLKNLCYVLSTGSEEYQDKAYALINKRDLIIEERVFYVMQSAPPQRYVKQIWGNFMKLNPGKEGLLFAAADAKGDFQEFAVLYLLDRFSRELTPSELDSVLQIISEILEKKAKERKEKLIEIMTQK